MTLTQELVVPKSIPMTGPWIAEYARRCYVTYDMMGKIEKLLVVSCSAVETVRMVSEVKLWCDEKAVPKRKKGKKRKKVLHFL
jgi:hypothetical protein